MKKILSALLLALIACALGAILYVRFAQPQAAPAPEPAPTAVTPAPAETAEPAETPAPEPEPRDEPAETPEPTPEPTPTPTPEPEAEAVKITVTYRGKLCDVLTDGKFTTAKNYWPGDTMTVKASGEMRALYIMWDYDPGEWTLIVGEQEIPCGQHGYRHEYIVLPEACTELKMRLPTGADPELAEVWAFGAGARPDWVQDWSEPWDEADLLLFPTHSDDEFVYMGGTIPYYIAQGMRVQVAYVVKHRTYRYHEMLDSLWEAGIRNYPVTSNKADMYESTVGGAARDYGTDYMTSYMVEQIRRFKPLVVVGHAEDGDSGHSVHVFGVMCLKDAVERAGDAKYYPASAEKYGVWDPPKTYLHLYGEDEQMVTLDFDAPLGYYGGLSAFEVADRAFEKCVSQFQMGKYHVYRADSEHDTRRYGLFRSTVGADEALDDLFEHVDAAAPRG